MKKITLIIIGLLIFLAGCGGNNSDMGGGSDKTFIGGDDSIEFEFLEETPPKEVYDGGDFPFEVILNVENKGEYDVPTENIELMLSGFFPQDFNSPVIKKRPDEDLDRSFIDSDGDKEKGTITYVNFPGFNYVGSLTGSNKFTIRAEACFKYGTKAQADICILEDLTPNEKEVCKVDEGKSVESSSAPVQIENFDQEVAGTRKIKFAFDIVHRDNGLISQQGNQCSTEVAVRNKVNVKIDSGLSGLSCSGLEDGSATEGQTTIYNGKRKIVCIQDVSGISGDFEKKVNILVEYDYKKHIETDILVKHTTD